MLLFKINFSIFFENLENADLGIESLQLIIPKFRKRRRQVKSVDAIGNQIVQNSHEFGQKDPTNTNKHVRKSSVNYESQYQASNFIVMNPSIFLRNNFSMKELEDSSEHKTKSKNILMKPLSLGSSLKKFEIEQDDILKFDSKLKFSKNILNKQIQPMSTIEIKGDDLAKTIFFNKRNTFKIDNSQPEFHHFSEKKTINTNRYIKLPKLENMKCLPAMNLNKRFDQKIITTHRNPDFIGKLEKYCTKQKDEEFLNKCEKGNFKPCLRYPFDTKKSVGPEEFHVTAYFGSK